MNATVKTLVKQICHGDSTAIAQKHVALAIDCARNPDMASFLAHYLIEAIDEHASHPYQVHKCLFIIEEAIHRSCKPFIDAMKVFSPDIRMITLLTFERYRCPIRPQIHKTAFSIYNFLEHGRSLNAEDYEAAVQTTFHRPLADATQTQNSDSESGETPEQNHGSGFGSLEQHVALSEPVVPNPPVRTEKPSHRMSLDPFALFNHPSAPKPAEKESESQRRKSGSFMLQNITDSAQNPFGEPRTDVSNPFMEIAQSPVQPQVSVFQVPEFPAAPVDPFAGFRSEPVYQNCFMDPGFVDEPRDPFEDMIIPAFSLQLNIREPSMSMADVARTINGVKDPFADDEDIFDPFAQVQGMF